MKTILIDVDDVICKNHFIPVINKYLRGREYTENDFNTIKYEKELFPTDEEINKFYDFFTTVDSYENLPLKDGAYEVLEKLTNKYRVLFLTNACHYERELDMGRQFFDKWKYLLTTLPFFPPDNIIFSAQKDVFKADMIIDDRVQNMGGDIKYKLLFTCFHNKNIPDAELKKLNIVRVNNWAEVEKFINKVFGK